MPAIIGVDKPVRHNIRLLRRMRDIRIEARVSHLALGALIGVTYSTISRWECHRNTPTILNFEAWANALGYDVMLVKRRRKK